MAETKNSWEKQLLGEEKKNKNPFGCAKWHEVKE